MKRVAFCDMIMPHPVYGYIGAYRSHFSYFDDIAQDRLDHNRDLMSRPSEKYEIMQYTEIDISQIRKDHLDFLITHINEGDEFFPARLIDIQQIHQEFPDMKTLIYTDRNIVTRKLEYEDFTECGVYDILWRNPEKYDQSTKIILKWLENGGTT
ncbi:hypothetical protein GF361_00275 [Candidatus Woesearchaeota archaeon]|nr:hypothetical protein [Candidatus Woesearchaeota archaeon]